MFVSKRTHEAALQALRQVVANHNHLRREWDALVSRINKLGGEAFLKSARIPRSEPQPFDADDLQRLILLCHPDKHGGKAMATEMTQKLLKMKERM